MSFCEECGFVADRVARRSSASLRKLRRMVVHHLFKFWLGKISDLTMKVEGMSPNPRSPNISSDCRTQRQPPIMNRSSSSRGESTAVCLMADSILIDLGAYL
jgi:hypothetical protein